MSRYPVRSSASVALFALLLPLSAVGIAHAQVTRNVTLLSHMNLYSSYTNSWPYIHTDGREYVAVGTRLGTSIVRLTDPNNPVEVGFIPGFPCATRDVDQYQTYIFALANTTAQQGIQIISMADPDHPVLVKTVHGVVETAENITIDPARGLLFTSVSDSDGGLRIISLADPLNPVLLYSSPYGSHDFTFRGNMGYAADIFSGLLHVLNTTSPSAPQEIVTLFTGGLVHSCWPADDGRYLYVTNEDPKGGDLIIYDNQNPAQPIEVFRSEVAGPATVHYPRILGNRLFIAHYPAGARVMDLSNPIWPVETGYLDTYAGSDAFQNGIYDTSPYYPSGIATATDRSSGLYVYRVGINYGLVRGTVLDGSNRGLPLAGATVRSLSDGASAITSADGRFAIAPTPGGAVQVEASKFGYVSQTATLNVTQGSDQTVSFTISQGPTGSVKGTVTQSANQTALASVEVTAPGTPLLTTTSMQGAYSFTKVPAGPISVRAERPGYVPATGAASVVAKKTVTLNFALSNALFYDDVDTDRGWTIGAPDDDATAGQWVRAVPVGTIDINHTQIQPGEDHSPSPSTQCFVTGNGPPHGDPSASDVDGGKTTLTSPVLPMTGVADPRIVFWRWFYDSSNQPTGSHLATEISNDGGATWITAESTEGPYIQWGRVELRVTDYFPTPGNLRVRFIAVDPTNFNIVEAAIDDFEYYSGTGAASAASTFESAAKPVTASATVQISSIRTSREGTTLELRLDRDAPRAVARLFDISGRLVRTILDGPVASGTSHLAWDGRTDRGEKAAAGVYLLRLTAGESRAQAKVVLLR